MKVLRRYIASAVFLAILLVLLVIVALNALGLLVEQVSDIKGQYGFMNVLVYILWHVPGYIVNNIGFATLIGCLIGLGVLANNNELTVVRASGVSIMQIIWLVMRPVLLIIFIGLIIGEFSPYADRIAEGYRDMALYPVKEKKNNGKNVHGNNFGKRLKEKLKRNANRLHLSASPSDEKSLWNREHNEFIRFATVLPNGKIYGITRFSFNDDKTLSSVQYAGEGTYQHDGWLLENVKTVHFSGTSPDKFFSEETQESLYWTTQLTPEMLTFVSTSPESLTFRELDRYGSFLKEQQRDSRPYELEWWKKVIKPFEIFSLVLVAISFVFGSLRQVTIGQRVFMGAIVGIVFQTLQNMFTTSSLVFGFSPVVAVLLPICVCACIGFVAIARVR